MNLAESMRRDWDERARKDAFYYIASWRKGWDSTAFLASGEEDYKRLVAPSLSRADFSSQGKTMLELGCGAGRMTSSFASRFGNVIALDVSAEMLDRGRKLLGQVSNIAWVHGNGVDLSGADDGSVDFVFSYLVLQHLPAEDLVCSYIREMLRVLRPGGLCLFQWNGMERPTMNWRGQLAWGAIDALWAIRLESSSRSLARLFRFDPQMAGKSWHGTAMSAARVRDAARSSGGTVVEIRDERTPVAWCCARKDSPAFGARTS
jgi:ubiquinone/menaquinone biosynthesis C-methylase UbiE